MQALVADCGDRQEEKCLFMGEPSRALLAATSGLVFASPKHRCPAAGCDMIESTGPVWRCQLVECDAMRQPTDTKGVHRLITAEPLHWCLAQTFCAAGSDSQSLWLFREEREFLFVSCRSAGAACCWRFCTISNAAGASRSGCSSTASVRRTYSVARCFEHSPDGFAAPCRNKMH